MNGYFADSTSLSYSGQERRRHPRIYDFFPIWIRLRSVDANGAVFIADTVLDNFSAGGLYVRLVRHVAPGARLFGVVRLSTTPAPNVPAPWVALRAVVRRVEPQPDGTWGVAVAFTRHRFL